VKLVVASVAFIASIFLSIEDIAVQIEEPFAVLPLELQHTWLLRDVGKSRSLMDWTRRHLGPTADEPDAAASSDSSDSSESPALPPTSASWASSAASRGGGRTDARQLFRQRTKDPPAAAAAPAPAAAAAAASAPAAAGGFASFFSSNGAARSMARAERSAKERLTELNDLLGTGLVTRAEYDERRQAILSEL